jgi:two-component system, cell cycle sensor histidine kinase and response regulator CckA
MSKSKDPEAKRNRSGKQKPVRRAKASIPAAAVLHESEERFHKAFEQGSIGMVLLDRDLRIIRVNRALSRMLAYPGEELLGAGIVDFIHPDDLAENAGQLRRLSQGEIASYRREHRYLRKDGEAVLSVLTASLLLDSSGKPLQVLCMIENITGLKVALEELRRSEALLAEAQRIAQLGSWEWDLTKNEGRWSEELYRIFGLAPRSVRASLESLLSYAHPDDHAMVRRHVQEALTQGKPFSIEHQILLPDGSKRVIHEQAEVVRDGEGRAVRIRGTIQDITDRRELEQQLQQSQKIEAIGLLAGGIAHDFNNLLTVILGQCELLLRRLAPDGPLIKEAFEIQKAAEQAQRLTSQLLAFSRKQVLEPRVLDLNTEIQRMTDMLKRLIGEDIDLVLELEPQLGRVKADPGQLEQVILNLAINARDAMPHGGRLTVETANAKLDEASGMGQEKIATGRYVTLSVDDTGVGMNSDTLARIFEPFFTTKPAGQGTGLGLATVYGIVKQSNGYIWAYSEPGLGATFRIYLPQLEEEWSAASAASLPETAYSATETVLLVEDDAAVRNVAREFLDLAGYQVLEAKDITDAIELCKTHRSTIHLLITDVVMPQMSGPELARHLIDLRPKMKVLFVSGYPGSTIVQQGGLTEESHLLQKPYRFDTLTRKVREVLLTKNTGPPRFVVNEPITGKEAAERDELSVVGAPAEDPAIERARNTIIAAAQILSEKAGIGSGPALEQLKRFANELQTRAGQANRSGEMPSAGKEERNNPKNLSRKRP